MGLNIEYTHISREYIGVYVSSIYGALLFSTMIPLDLIEFIGLQSSLYEGDAGREKDQSKK